MCRRIGENGDECRCYKNETKHCGKKSIAIVKCFGCLDRGGKIRVADRRECLLSKLCILRVANSVDAIASTEDDIIDCNNDAAGALFRLSYVSRS